MKVQRLTISHNVWTTAFTDDWIRLHTSIGRLDITEEDGRIIVRAVDEKLFIEPAATGQIILTTSK